jgi:flagellar capping protein FliD
MAMNISSLLGNNYSFLNYNNNSIGSKKSSNIANLWNNYTSAQSDSAASRFSASNIYDVRSSAAEVVASYDSAKKEFDTEVSGAMKDLSDSVSKFRKTDFDLKPEDLTKETKTVTDKDGKTSTVTESKYSDRLKAAMDNVKDLVDSYNNANQLFQDNSAVSKRIGNMASMFADTAYRADNYASVGITVDGKGKLSVDEEKLAAALTENPSKVERIMGDEGLAGKAESHMSVVNVQKDKLFPAASSMFGSELKTAQAYTGKGLTNMVNYANVGNLLNTFF